mmetsp:Transcript_5168/g.13915  ORF Transcript_5168/g.13915 Transcript_5168/m.13915 type:complete len:204 (+) Transcript_5168:565-1176(+)
MLQGILRGLLQACGHQMLRRKQVQDLRHLRRHGRRLHGDRLLPQRHHLGVRHLHHPHIAHQHQAQAAGRDLRARPRRHRSQRRAFAQVHRRHRPQYQSIEHDGQPHRLHHWLGNGSQDRGCVLDRAQFLGRVLGRDGKLPHPGWTQQPRHRDGSCMGHTFHLHRPELPMLRGWYQLRPGSQVRRSLSTTRTHRPAPVSGEQED